MHDTDTNELNIKYILQTFIHIVSKFHLSTFFTFHCTGRMFQNLYSIDLFYKTVTSPLASAVTNNIN